MRFVLPADRVGFGFATPSARFASVLRSWRRLKGARFVASLRDRLAATLDPTPRTQGGLRIGTKGNCGLRPRQRTKPGLRPKGYLLGLRPSKPHLSCSGPGSVRWPPVSVTRALLIHTGFGRGRVYPVAGRFAGLTLVPLRLAYAGLLGAWSCSVTAGFAGLRSGWPSVLVHAGLFGAWFCLVAAGFVGQPARPSASIHAGLGGAGYCSAGWHAPLL